MGRRAPATTCFPGNCCPKAATSSASGCPNHDAACCREGRSPGGRFETLPQQASAWQNPGVNSEHFQEMVNSWDVEALHNSADTQHLKTQCQPHMAQSLLVFSTHRAVPGQPCPQDRFPCTGDAARSREAVYSSSQHPCLMGTLGT